MFPYIYDIFIAAILLVCIGFGYKRGVLRTILELICFIIAFSAASLISSYEASLQLYESYLREPIISVIDSAVQKAKEEAFDKIKTEADDVVDTIVDESLNGSDEIKAFIKQEMHRGGDAIKEGLPKVYEALGIDLQTLLTNPLISDKIDKIADEYSGTITDEINNQLPLGITVSEDQIEEIMKESDAAEALVYEVFGLKSDNSDTNGAAGYVEKTVIRRIAVRAISMLLWTVSFSVINIILRIVIKILLVVRKIEPIKACDSIIGAALGAVAGIAAAAVCCIIIILLTELTGGMTYMNSDVFDKTIIFGKFYDLISEMIIAVTTN